LFEDVAASEGLADETRHVNLLNSRGPCSKIIKVNQNDNPN